MSEQTSRSSRTTHPAITIYSPAAPPNMLWSINEEIAAKLNACSADDDVAVIAQALPDSINAIGKLSERGVHLPIVTTADFLPAVKGTGAAWHHYARPHEDLKFVASLYEVGIGMMVFDDEIQTPKDLKGKTIAVPRRPSSLRVMAEALLGDGWGVLGDVVLIDLPPNAVADAAAAGTIDATTWNMMVETPNGYRPLLPSLPETGRWLSVSEADVKRINANNDFVTRTVTVKSAAKQAGTSAGAAPTLLSFRQSLAAWSSTSDEQITDILKCLDTDQNGTATAINDWPGLEEEAVHAAALRYYRSKDPQFLKHSDKGKQK